MESTSQTNNHGCFWYLFCCCLCGSSEDTSQQRVANATDPLLRTSNPKRYEAMGARQVTFDSSRPSPTRGILKRVTSDHSINGRGRIEQMPVLSDPPASRREEAKTPPRSPGSDRSFGSNPNSPVHGQTAKADYSQWKVGKGISSPDKNGDKI